MMNNTDFKSMLSTVHKSDTTGRNNPHGSNEKMRYDLKQVSQWDRQNQSKAKSKKQKSEENEEDDDNDHDEQQSTSKVSYKNKDANNVIKNKPMYRDRALERRQNENNEEIQKFEEIVSKLNVEQTKMLGGDIEHTHMVKGLDYTLLNKMRDTKTTNINSSTEFQSTEAITMKSKHIPIKTIQGENIWKFLSQNQKKNPISLQNFQKLAFEVNLDLKNDDLPILITRSKQVLLISSIFDLIFYLIFIFFIGNSDGR